MDFSVLNFPKANLKLQKQGNEVFVWCEIRRKKLRLSPEEWVRQHLIHYLLHHKNYPLGRMASEVQLELNGQKKRCDLLVVDDQGTPYLLVECKAPTIPLDHSTINQTVQYNSQLQVPYLAMTNGVEHYIFHLRYEDHKAEQLADFPDSPGH
ncbi:MAG: type I restriction enzyme HsdR N-terminal domain-containing protein [Bacteroidetes bacterium]|nr:MAG: type I restriction enzyme HsdR N-terminal domain-containing protein [Bacteroidota bacterium]